eukprot:TRINITY_DN22_c1_g2_i1.p1 TRINITY_DN22_c1_g2~~TRINITY_DN22_c1_g2_i1.p1  ORF type:complete len:218 (-),score=-22.81 TRINITY_DN22_c1_g2_i1:528-1181(-)
MAIFRNIGICMRINFTLSLKCKIKQQFYIIIKNRGSIDSNQIYYIEIFYILIYIKKIYSNICILQLISSQSTYLQIFLYKLYNRCIEKNQFQCRYIYFQIALADISIYWIQVPIPSLILQSECKACIIVCIFILYGCSMAHKHPMQDCYEACNTMYIFDVRKSIDTTCTKRKQGHSSQQKNHNKKTSQCGNKRFYPKIRQNFTKKQGYYNFTDASQY